MGVTAGHPHILDEKSLTWYKILRNAINKMDRKEEVLLGFTCTSMYPLVSMAARDTIQHVLKAEDMVVYRILKRLATDTRVDIILDDKPVMTRQDRRGVRTVIADSQEDESQLFDDSCKQPRSLGNGRRPTAAARALAGRLVPRRVSATRTRRTGARIVSSATTG